MPTTILPATVMLALGIFASGLLLALGCGGSAANPQPKVRVAQDDPEGEFEWGMKRLKRALRLFRPSGAEGLSITERKVKHELFPPSEANPNFTARVSITSEAAFLHGRRVGERDDTPKSAPDNAAEINDPLADDADELNRVLDIPGAGPQAPAAASTTIETRSLENETVFDMAYVDGHWKLTQQPELKHEQLWFEYAFE